MSDRTYNTSWKGDKIPVEFGESRTVSIFEFTAGSGWERRLLFANRWSRTSNICIRMLSVTINASANMAFTEQNLDIGDLCEINPINSVRVRCYLFDPESPRSTPTIRLMNLLEEINVWIGVKRGRK